MSKAERCTMDGDEIEAAFLEERAWIVRLDPCPGL